VTLFLTAVALVMVFEGLVFALAPRRIEQALIWLASLSVESRRMMGLATVAAGVALLWLAKFILA
jgi:uncharacterized protein